MKRYDLPRGYCCKPDIEAPDGEWARCADLDAAVAAEREACAKVVKGFVGIPLVDRIRMVNAIRARSQAPVKTHDAADEAAITTGRLMKAAMQMPSSVFVSPTPLKPAATQDPPPKVTETRSEASPSYQLHYRVDGTAKATPDDEDWATVEDALRAERDALRAEVEGFKAGSERNALKGIAMRSEIDALTERNAGLRSALRDIADRYDNWGES